MERETKLVRNGSPGAGLLQRREQRGQNVQLTGGTSLLSVCSPEEMRIVTFSI